MPDEVKVTPPKEGPKDQPKIPVTGVPQPTAAPAPVAGQTLGQPGVQPVRNATAAMAAQPGPVKQQTATGEVQADEKQIAARNAERVKELEAELAQLRASRGPENTQGATAGPHTEKLPPNPTVDRAMKEDNPPQSAGPARRNTPGSPVGAENASPGDTAGGQPVGAPAVAGSAIRDRIKAIDKQLQAAEDEGIRARRDDIVMLQAQKRELEEREAREVYGAPVLAPKTRLLDASFAEQKNPEYHYRWLNVTDPSRVSARMAVGYEPVPVEEGGMQLGTEMKLFRISKDYYLGRTKHLRKEHEAQFKAPDKQYEQVVEEVVKRLRDQFGIKISEKQLQDTTGL